MYVMDIFLSNGLPCNTNETEVSRFFTICASVRDARIVFPVFPHEWSSGVS